ncbi:MAG TPA: PAS domain S-box protein [Methanoregulaceae archaeon]|nr:PAS domain S-box protein [Methanoregulaceae archaeon]
MEETEEEGEVVGMTDERAGPTPPIPFELIAEHTPYPMALVDQKGRYRFVNARFRELFGFGADEVPAGCEWFDLTFPDEEERRSAISLWKEDMGHGIDLEPEPRLFRVRCRDGTDRQVLFRSIALGTGDRLIACEDLTAVLERQEALEDLNRRLSDIIEFLPDPTFVIDANRAVIAWNRAMVELTGIRKEEVLGRTDRAYAVPFYGDARSPLLADRILSDRDDGELGSYSALDRQDGTLVAEIFLPAWDEGAGRYLWGKATRLLSSDGTPAGAIESIRDITAFRRAEEELRKSEERYRALVESINDVIYAVDDQGRITYVSPVIQYTSGYRPEELIGRRFFEFVHPCDRAEVKRRFEELVAGGEGPHEFRMIDAWGGEHWIRTYTHPIEVDGELVELRGVLTDITEQKEQEAAVLRSEALLARITDLSPFGYCVVDSDTDRFLYMNDRFCRIWKWEGLCDELRRHDFLHSDFLAWVAPIVEDPAAFIESGAILQDGEDAHEVMDEIRLCDGRTLWRYSARVRDDEGRSIGCLYLYKDITDERRQVEELKRYRDELERLVEERTQELTRTNEVLVQEMAVREHLTRRQIESEERFSRIFDQAPIGMAVVSLDDRFLRVNEALCRITGYSREELLEMGPFGITHPDDVAEGRALTKNLLEGTSDDYSRDKRYLRRDGTVVWVHMTVGVVRDPSGHPFHLFSMTEDITAQRAAEERLRISAAALKESNEDLQRFAYIASHDLQEPLRTVISFSQLLERRLADQADPEIRELLGFIVEGGVRMQTLIRDLLIFSRVVTGGRTFQTTDTNEVVSDVLKSLGASIEETGAEVNVHPLPVVLSDPSQLHQVFLNLIGNAIKYRRAEPPTIEISAERRGDDWVFSVRDNGIGIEPRHHDRVFEIFQRLHTSAEYEGTGIGLAVVRRIVERHGGRVWVESTPGVGSTFFFSLPAI